MTTKPHFNANAQHDLLHDAAHQLKTPLSVIKGYVDIMQTDDETRARHDKILEATLRQVERMQGIIADMLEYAQLEAGVEIEKRPCNLRRILNAELAMLDGLTQESGVTLHVTVDEGAHHVLGDEGLLAQVLNNLIENAIKYNRDGGEVWVTLRHQGTQIRIDVRDTGIGIPEADLPHIFERFYRARNTARKRGSGLGLAIVKIIVERHGGEVWATSAPNEGSTFSVTLPAARNGAGAAGLDSSEASDALHDSLQDSDDDYDESQDEDV
jgi:two-component system phosphate regulon sensor histidine kinase PhoR